MRLETLTLMTRDLPRARSFYTAKLGFPVVDDRDGEWFVVDAGGIKLHVDRSTVQKAPLENPEPRLVFHTSDLKSRCLLLRDRGVSVDGPLASPGASGLYAQLADPDGHPIVLRPVSSEDAMTADWSRLPYELMERISTRITNEVPDVNRVVLDITSKPPGTIEWE